jgi:hypothetical protein
MVPKLVLIRLLILFATFTLPALAQPPDANTTTPGPGLAPIQDNSFLIEEAYNQEPGVIQHISTFTHLWTCKDWVYNFTEEWPVPGHSRHQLSYTMNVVSAGAYPGSGLGDSLLNYRYQLIGSGETRLAVSPRLSVIAPTGNSEVGRGYGGFGIQTNLPVSIVISKHVVTHWNAGFTVIPSSANSAGDHAFATGINLGQSIVWLARPRLNALLETSWTTSQAVVGSNRTQDLHTLFLNPGIRRAYNLKSGMQIVPGIALPIGVGPSAGEGGLSVYLSVEHPLRFISQTR